MPLRVTNEPIFLRSFQYKVLNSILYTNTSSCFFCHLTAETTSHIFFDCSFSHSFQNEICIKILSKLDSSRSLSLEYRDISFGLFTREMDLLNCILILGKSYLWACWCKETKPSFSHFERTLLNKNQTEKYNIVTSFCLRKNGESMRK